MRKARENEMDTKVKEIYLQRLVERALDHCIAVDYDSILLNYDNWDDYLMETFGTTHDELMSVGIALFLKKFPEPDMGKKVI